MCSSSSALCFQNIIPKYKIIIADASNKLEAKKNLENINRLKDILDIHYISQPNCSVKEATIIMTNFIKTKYSVIVSDGGLLNSSVLEKYIDFLEKNKEYVAVHGKTLLFQTKHNKVFGEIINFVNYNLPVIEEKDCLSRLKYYLSKNNYTPSVNCLMRSNIWKSIWQHSKKINIPSISSELIPSVLCVGYGTDTAPAPGRSRSAPQESSLYTSPETCV